MRKRAFIFVAAGILAAGGIWLGRAALTHRALAAVLTNPSPTEQSMDDFIGTASDPPAALRQLWQTRRIQQRLFALGYVRSRAGKDEALWQACRPMVLEASHCLDSEFQTAALQMLWEKKDTQWLPTAQAFLHSADPEVRVAALTKLNFEKDKTQAALFARMLDDSDGQVQIVATAGLRNLTSVDFPAPPETGGKMPLPDMQKWKQWWEKNQADFPAQTPAPAWSQTPPADTQEFDLPDLHGRRVALHDFRGKVVLLSFWATWCPACGTELETLRDLQARHPNDLVVLGINVDGLIDADDHLPDPTPEQLASTHAEILKLLADAHVTHATLLDPAGKVLGPYGAENLPTNVLIGPDGTLQRRLLGTRTLPAWEELIAAAKQNP